MTRAQSTGLGRDASINPEPPRQDRGEAVDTALAMRSASPGLVGALVLSPTRITRKRAHVPLADLPNRLRGRGVREH